MNFKDVELTEVENFFEPQDNKTIKLISSSSASVFFEWEYALAQDGGGAQYEVIFDKVGGDFSKPLYKVLANNKGLENNAYVSHKTLNTIAALAGINPGESGDVQWSVISSRGINTVLSSQIRTINITSLEGFAEIPAELYITGEGTESGDNVSEALPFKQTAAGEFEIYTNLESGEGFQFIERRDENAKRFYSSDLSKLKEVLESDDSRVEESGVYRISLDFNAATISMTRIKSLGLWFSPDNKVLFELPYKGKGIWEGTGTVNFKEESWGKDERYKFQMEVVKQGDTVVEQLGTKNPTDSKPNESSPASYYHIKLLDEVSQWDDKWKFASEVDGNEVTISVLLQGDNDYTHSIKIN
ncbi:MAG TPA: SusE domain-containing protein [Sphingobacterium sp.]|nr:SusE domain-containing protein [Sphingobacterium sp.]